MGAQDQISQDALDSAPSLSASDFDLEHPEFNENFDEVLGELVEKCPVVRGTQSTIADGHYILNRYEDVKRAGQDWKTFSSAKGFDPNRDPNRPMLLPEESDPPIHTVWRRALNPFFSPEVVATYEDSIREEAIRLIEGFRSDGECDYVKQFSSVLPGSAMFKNVLGIPPEDVPWLIEEMHLGFHGPLKDRGTHLTNAFTHLGQHLAARAEQPNSGDLVDTIAAGVEYENGELSSFEDRASILTDLALGGIVTATFVMSGGMLHLAEHPEDRRALVDDPDRIPQAGEEFVRFYPPVVALGRSVTAPVEMGGHQFREDDFVLLNYASASRDPAVVDNPQQCDISRERITHSAFGVGVHRCIGSHLARLEIKVALEEWLRRIPHFELKPETRPQFETGILRTMKTLQLTWPT
jgi:cytochrome P450